uniref:Uncharacterized protein n=1 Tax=Morchella brunnea TaxID=1174671 RepID=A0A8K1I7N6_9PEZI|nr:hypothetical protein LK370_mgp194 [Morchella brunnea]UBU98438.1 hypothetical protein [Morchella brunnea]
MKKKKNERGGAPPNISFRKRGFFEKREGASSTFIFVENEWEKRGLGTPQPLRYSQKSSHYLPPRPWGYFTIINAWIFFTIINGWIYSPTGIDHKGLKRPLWFTLVFGVKKKHS